MAFSGKCVYCGLSESCNAVNCPLRSDLTDEQVNDIAAGRLLAPVLGRVRTLGVGWCAPADSTFVTESSEVGERINRVAAALLPTDSKERKDTPIYSGVLRYFPLALAEIARLSKAGNDKHNPGEPLHWSRGKSNDHADCIARHLVELGAVDPDDGHRHATKLAWRALAALQLELEDAQKAGKLSA